MTEDVTASRLREIADAPGHNTSRNVSGSTWKIPLVHREPIAFATRRTTELEIELEFERARGGNDLTAE